MEALFVSRKRLEPFEIYCKEIRALSSSDHRLKIGLIWKSRGSWQAGKNCNLNLHPLPVAVINPRIRRLVDDCSPRRWEGCSAAAWAAYPGVTATRPCWAGTGLPPPAASPPPCSPPAAPRRIARHLPPVVLMGLDHENHFNSNFLLITSLCTSNERPVRININVLLLFMYSQKWNCAALLFPKLNNNVFSPDFYTHISVRDLYTIFPGSSCLYCCSQMCGPILGIYKSLTDT